VIQVYTCTLLSTVLVAVRELRFSDLGTCHAIYSKAEGIYANGNNSKATYYATVG